jgi:hypothetical protein
MKELIKPNVNENFLNEVSALCEIDCNGPVIPCNKYCQGKGTVNESVGEDDDIIF